VKQLGRRLVELHARERIEAGSRSPRH
jgi:hypothetical protein